MTDAAKLNGYFHLPISEFARIVREGLEFA